MTDNSIVLPFVSHLFLGIVLLFFWRKTNIQRIISVIGNIIVVVISVNLFRKSWDGGVLTMQAGDWPAPFGITMVADIFSATMIFLCSLAGVAVAVYSTAGISELRQRYGYFPILHFLLMGLNGAFLTGDIFNLYVWFEIVIISSFVLMTLGGKKPQIEGAINYVTMNLLASAIFLTAIAILYGLTGTLNMADLSTKIPHIRNQGLTHITALLFFIAFGIKSAVFPLYFWLPSSYHTPPSAIAAIFGGLLTKVGIYALVRSFTLIFIPSQFIIQVLATVAVFTLLTGAAGAFIQRDLRKMFSYLIVCHIGYMVSGLAMYNEVALAGTLFYMVHDIVVKTNLFLVSGLINKIRGTMDTREIGGILRDYPRLSILMLVVFFSLCGIPPLSGFWPKIMLFKSAFTTQSYILLGALIVASFFTLIVMTRMWAAVFWKEPPAGSLQHDRFNDMPMLRKTMLVAPVILLAITSLYIGLGADNIFAVANRIASELLNTSTYVNTVLGRLPATP